MRWLAFILGSLALEIAFAHEAMATTLEAATQASGGEVASSSLKGRVAVGEPAVGKTAGPSQRATLGWIAATRPFFLSLTVNPTSWNLPGVLVNTSHLTGPAERIQITNLGETPVTLSLQSTSPLPWTAGVAPGPEIFSLSGIIAHPNDQPQPADFNTDPSAEDLITTVPKQATATLFGFPGALGTGEGLPPTEGRALSLLFKSPTQTQVTHEQQIQVTVTAEMP
jgi:hypothetical protein